MVPFLRIEKKTIEDGDVGVEGVVSPEKTLLLPYDVPDVKRWLVGELLDMRF